MKISLIIPVYNVENFLDRCLKSVQEQTYKAQVIIVNDGSTDGSLKIVEDYVTRNENFVCYTIENGGQGAARNFGLEKATGEYVVFLDSDDYIAPDCLARLLSAIEENNSDIAVCNCYDVDENGKILSRSEANIKNITTSLEESPRILFNRPCPWGKIYRKSLFEHLRFVPRVWYEDLRLIPKLLLEAKRITYIDDALFFYVQRQGSTMNNSKAVRNLEIIEAFEDLISHFKEKGCYEKFKDEFAYLISEHLAVAAVTRVVLSGATEKKTVLKQMQSYLAGFGNFYQNKYTYLLGFNKKLILFFNRHRLYFLTSLCMKIKRNIS